MPSIGYADLLKATRRLTRNQEEVDRVFRRMVFNAMAHNRDDHTKNHAFLLEANGEWKASPAFDLCFSAGAGYEHALDIAGEGRNPTGAHLAEVARTTGVADKTLRECVDQVRAAVARWPRIAAAAGVSKATTTLINDHLKSLGPWRP